MQDESPKVSKIKVRSDWPVGMSSTDHGANLNAVAFNLQFIMERNPQLAMEIIEQFRQARALRPDDPVILRQQDHQSAMADLERLGDWPVS